MPSVEVSGLRGLMERDLAGDAVGLGLEACVPSAAVGEAEPGRPDWSKHPLRHRVTCFAEAAKKVAKKADDEQATVDLRDLAELVRVKCREELACPT